MAVTSIQKLVPGTSRNRHRATTFMRPNTNAGTLRLPLKNLSDMSPENTVPTMPHTELIEIMKLASRVVYPF